MRNPSNSFLLYLTGIISCLIISTSYADQDPISLFPLDNYDQTVSTWIKPEDTNFDKALLNADMQQKHLHLFYDHYFGSLSPWNAGYVNRVLKQTSQNDLQTLEQSLINDFNNDGKADTKIGYGENFRPHTKEWIDDIANNMNIAQFDGLNYQANHRGIAIDNLHARALPTEDVSFYSHKLAGEGYPFDNLQISALWVGTPVYVIGETRDHAWLLVIAPDYIAWVKSTGIARTDNVFINTWNDTSKNKLAAITHTQTSILDEKGRFLFSAYVGAVFPSTVSPAGIQLMVPVADINHNAIIKNATVSTEYAAVMPIAATPHQFSHLMKTMINRPYGWGSMYFYNDCSAELKSLMTPFGIWLPTHSSNQITIGKMVDMTHASAEKRLSYLMENGQPFLTIIYIGGHVVLYMGNYPDPKKTGSWMAMTYQNLWGLNPMPSNRRAVIGKSVLFPLLLQYPEDPSLESLANDEYFQVSYLNQLSNTDFQKPQKTVALKSLIYPEKEH